MPQNLLFHCFLKCCSHGSEWPSSKNLQTINAGEGKEKREPFCQISNLGMQIVRATVDIPLYGICMDIPLKNWEYNYPVIQQLHYWAFTPEETVTEKHTRTSLFITASFAIARTCKQPRRPWTDEHIKKLWCADTMEYYLTTKRNTSDSVLMRWMNLESVIQSEVSQKEKKILYVNTCLWVQKDGTAGPICRAGLETDTESRLTDTGQGGRGADRERSAETCTVPYVKRTAGADLLMT